MKNSQRKCRNSEAEADEQEDAHRPTASAMAHVPLLKEGVTSTALRAIVSTAAGLNDSGTAARQSTAAILTSTQAARSARVLEAI